MQTEKKEKSSFFIKIINWMKKHKLLCMLFAVVAIIIFLIFGISKKETQKDYITVNIARGDLMQTVTATGEINPVNTVSVGSQVSGTIDAIYVDYNTRVKKGDVLLTIEPSVLQSSVDEAMASLKASESQLNFAKSEYQRNKSLYDAGFISRAEMEQSLTSYEQAEQSVKKAQYSYNRALTNLGYATIKSPVDGTVISRKVDKGQTVAASFQTPDLFEIAEDLSKMQIETSVSEADIGMIKEGQTVTFTVDAYSSVVFEGEVHQIRLSPTTTSNVVVYTVVIDVDNADLRLMPGMTAFVTIVVAESKDAWKVQNSGLLVRSFKNVSDNIPADVTPQTHLAIKRGNNVVFVPYKKGLVTATETEIIAEDLQEKDKIIIGRMGQESTIKKSNNKGPMGHPGGPM